MAIVPFLLCLASLLSTTRPDFDTARPGIDVLGYTFRLTLSDESDLIKGRASVTVRFTDGPRDFYLDLVSEELGGKGMSVTDVEMDGRSVRFEHDDDRLWMRLGQETVDSVETFMITYSGVPDDGLIISKNRFGDRTFFADNWPNRARYWIPTVDVPSDKALVDFIVTAPSHYQVISNGRLVEESDVEPGLRRTHWSSTEVIPTKIMTLGVARFAVQHLGEVEGTPLETWVYPQDREPGFRDFAVAEQILRYLTQVLGPFPFAKLANVQSTTRYGGMENATAIFYAENSVSGTGRLESVIAHEISHQWFGDSASEEDWYDVWLSEGFATYLADLYEEHQYGVARFQLRMGAERRAVFQYDNDHPKSSIVDTSITDPNNVLSRDVYEKGAWVLHMLRSMLGDETFWKVLRTYYEQYSYGNATTDDFVRVAESVSGVELSWFFDQWIYRPGVPELWAHWRYDPDSREIVLDVEQRQALLYRLTLDVQIEVGGKRSIQSVEITDRHQTIRMKVERIPEKVRLDPNVRLLAHLLTG